MAYVINLDEYADFGTHRIALYNSNIEIIYFDSFVVEHAPKEIEIFIGHKNIRTNVMLAGKTLINYASLFSPYDFEKNDNIILNYFKNE